MTFTYPEVTTIDTFYTTADGYLITPQTLEYGTGYSIVEVQAPYGYVLNSEPVYFDVTQDGSAEESGITVIEVVRSNMAQKGTITVSKSGEVFTSVSENNGMYQPVFAVQGLEGAVYEITAAEDIVWLTPILPFINDTEENISGILDMCIEAKVYGIICFGMGLTLREGNREYFYEQLDRLYPRLKEKYIERYGNQYIIASPNNTNLIHLFHKKCEQYGIIHNNEQIFNYLRTFEEKNIGKQLSLWDLEMVWYKKS